MSKIIVQVRHEDVKAHVEAIKNIYVIDATTQEITKLEYMRVDDIAGILTDEPDAIFAHIGDLNK